MSKQLKTQEVTELEIDKLKGEMLSNKQYMEALLIKLDVVHLAIIGQNSLSGSDSLTHIGDFIYDCISEIKQRLYK